LIDLNQAEILCKRMELNPNRRLGDHDWIEILASEREALRMFPDLVSELKAQRKRTYNLTKAILETVECIKRQPIEVVADTIMYDNYTTLCDILETEVSEAIND
jgi:hypothetical protein